MKVPTHKLIRFQLNDTLKGKLETLMKRNYFIKYLILASVISAVAFAQPSSQVPENALKSKVRVVMMGDLFVIDTPEGMEEVWLLCARSPQLKPDGSHEYMAVQARNFTRREIGGKDVWIWFDNPRNTPRRDYEGHLMAYVYYTKQGNEPTANKTAILNEELIKNGLARVDSTYSCSRRNQMNDLQQTAKNNKLGIWSVPPR